MLARGGRMSLLGLPDGPVTLDLNDQVIFKEARLQGITGREMFRTWQQTTTLLSTGRVDVAPVITHRFPLERFEEAFATTASGRSGKVILLAGGVTAWDALDYPEGRAAELRRAGAAAAPAHAARARRARARGSTAATSSTSRRTTTWAWRTIRG